MTGGPITETHQWTSEQTTEHQLVMLETSHVGPSAQWTTRFERSEGSPGFNYGRFKLPIRWEIKEI